jgi:hypothetical protein
VVVAYAPDFIWAPVIQRRDVTDSAEAVAQWVSAARLFTPASDVPPVTCD